MNNNLIRAWIYKDFTNTYLGGFYLPNQTKICTMQKSFENAKEDLIKKAQSQGLTISMVIEFASFKEVEKNRG